MQQLFAWSTVLCCRGTFLVLLVVCPRDLNDGLRDDGTRLSVSNTDTHARTTTKGKINLNYSFLKFPINSLLEIQSPQQL